LASNQGLSLFLCFRDPKALSTRSKVLSLAELPRHLFRDDLAAIGTTHPNSFVKTNSTRLGTANSEAKLSAFS
jgi:hypothetical protein